MKSIGIVRKIDNLGRICIPMEARQNLGVALQDTMEIYVDEDMVILKKYSHQCVLCSSMENIEKFKDKNICRECLIELTSNI